MQAYKYEATGELKGHVMLKPRTLPEKYRLLADCDFKLDPDGNPIQGLENLPAIANAIELSEKYYKEVAVKSGDKSHKSFKDMSYDPGCEAFLQEVAMHIVGGAPGEK